jgi:hypothetical protein
LLLFDPGSHPPGQTRKTSGQILGSYVLPSLSETERQVQLNTGHIAIFDYDLLTELALALGAFALQQVPPTSFRTHDLTCGGNLETLGHRLLGFLRAIAFGMGRGQSQS